MQKITPNLWFNRNAKEAVDFYISVFSEGKIISTSRYPTEGLADFQKEFAGDVLAINFEIGGHAFTAINADNTFTPNASVSFSVMLKTKEEVNALWEKLLDGGSVLMPLQKYDFSEHYGWLSDKYGVSWQMIALGDVPITQKIVPSFMFTGTNAGKAQEAINFYISVFKEAKVGDIFRYPKGSEPDKEGTIAHSVITLEDQSFIAMDSAQKHEFNFNEGVSLNISCKDQEEIDYYWEKLSVVPEAEQCGWLKDKYGVSWQINPENMEELIQRPGAFQKMMGMKKIIIAEF
ncbi:MAG: VOC family protein [Candidatus Andersenbacteria bacterium]